MHCSPKGRRLTHSKQTRAQLVGASNGAKKRAARWHFFDRTESENYRNWRDEFGVFLWEGEEAYARLYNEARAKFGVGQRLRTCPGCLKCQHLHACLACEDEEYEGNICDRCARVHVVDEFCDGSGVLSARRTQP